MSIFGVGSIALLRNSANEEFGALITSVDETTDRYFVTKINSHKSNSSGAALEVIPKALRLDDGTVIQPGEDYVIKSLIGAPADIRASLDKAAKKVQQMTDMIGQVKVDLEIYKQKNDTALMAVINTLRNFADNQDLKDALWQAIKTGVEIKAPGVIERVPKGLNERLEQAAKKKPETVEAA